jgi:hypothetical protein
LSPGTLVAVILSVDHNVTEREHSYHQDDDRDKDANVWPLTVITRAVIVGRPPLLALRARSTSTPIRATGKLSARAAQITFIAEALKD